MQNSSHKNASAGIRNRAFLRFSPRLQEVGNAERSVQYDGQRRALQIDSEVCAI